MSQEEYVLLFIDGENKTVWVRKQTYAALSDEAKIAHANFESLLKEFAINGKYNGYKMFEIRKKEDNLDDQQPFSFIEVRIPDYIRNVYNNLDNNLNIESFNKIGGR